MSALLRNNLLRNGTWMFPCKSSHTFLTPLPSKDSTGFTDPEMAKIVLGPISWFYDGEKMGYFDSKYSNLCSRIVHFIGLGPDLVFSKV
jgi:hypothetical protein